MWRRIIADVKASTLKGALREEVDRQARVITDDYSAYRDLAPEFTGGHETVCHTTKEYVRLGTDIHTRTVESTHALVKRGIVGIHHNISREYLHRYLWHDFLWNNRELNDGERTILGIKSAEGKRLMSRSQWSIKIASSAKEKHQDATGNSRPETCRPET